MNEEQSKAVADALGGSAWNSGGGIHLVKFERSDGKLVVLSDEVVCEYKNEPSFDEGNPSVSIVLH